MRLADRCCWSWCVARTLLLMVRETHSTYYATVSSAVSSWSERAGQGEAAKRAYSQLNATFPLQTAEVLSLDQFPAFGTHFQAGVTLVLVVDLVHLVDRIKVAHDKRGLERPTRLDRSAAEFLDAIVSNREILLAPGAYDLSRPRSGTSPHVRCGKVYDGTEPIIVHVENLTIRGSSNGRVRVVAGPRYATVLTFSNVSS